MNKPLTKLQKELIKLMREGGELGSIGHEAWVINKTSDFIPVHFRTVGSLIYRGLLATHAQAPNSDHKHYSLTELGKNVQI